MTDYYIHGMTRYAESLVLLLAFGILHGQSLRDDMIELEKRVLWEAVKAKKMPLLKERIADDYMEVSDNGIFTKADVLETVPEIQVTDYSLTDFRTVALNKDAYVITYKVEQHWTYKGQPGPVHMFASSGWARRTGKWYVVFHQEITEAEK